MKSGFVKTDDAALKRAEKEVAPVLIHLKKLLRIKNRLCSPLLRLPTETIIRILSYNMEHMGYSIHWRSIISTCHHLHWIMCTTTELWWKVDCTCPGIARIAFARSKGSPQVMVVDLDPRDYLYLNHDARKVLDHWRDTQVLHGHRLHTLKLSGVSADLTHFSWIFERPLPRLRHLEINFFGPFDDDEYEELPIPEPVALCLPQDLQLRVLHLSNATLPWSSNIFTGLSELHMSFRGCDAVVEISADELLGIFEASPRLEDLSLAQVRIKIPATKGEAQFTPTRIAKLPNLVSLKLDNLPGFVGYTLIHMDTPAISSLQIRSHVLPLEVWWILGFFFLDQRVPGPKRLFPNPPVFGISVTDEDGCSDSVEIVIGGFKLRFDFDADEEELVHSAIMACILTLVPPSVAILELDDMEVGVQEWKEFFRSHPEVHSIKFPKQSTYPMPEALWSALSPAETDEEPLCPKLDSVSISTVSPDTLLLSCLQNRKNAGFGLRHLEISDLDDEAVEELSCLVEVLEAPSLSNEPFRRVRPVSMNELDFSRSPRLTVGASLRRGAH